MPAATHNLRIGSTASRNGTLKGLKSWVQIGDGMGRNHRHSLAGKWHEAIGLEIKISQ